MALCILHLFFQDIFAVRLLPMPLNMVLLGTAESPVSQAVSGRLASRNWQSLVCLEKACGSVWLTMHSAHKEGRGTQAGTMLIFRHMLLPGCQEMPFVKQQKACVKGL